METSATNDVSYRTFAGLSSLAGVRHGIFTRHGGVSRGAFASLNVVTGDGDDSDRVARNRQIVAEALGGGKLVSVRQVHGFAVKVVTAQDGQVPPAEADALVTDVPGVLLMVKAADCQPILICDPVRRVVAAVHSGWRGSVANIIGVTVARMQACYGSRPSDLVAGIGPSLGPCCGEFVNYRREIPEALWPFQVGPHHFDFWAVSRAQLLAAGLIEERIETAGVCTRCHTDTFFSYRGEGVTGRFAAVIGLSRNGSGDLDHHSGRPV